MTNVFKPYSSAVLAVTSTPVNAAFCTAATVTDPSFIHPGDAWVVQWMSGNGPASVSWGPTNAVANVVNVGAAPVFPSNVSVIAPNATMTFRRDPTSHAIFSAIANGGNTCFLSISCGHLN